MLGSVNVLRRNDDGSWDGEMFDGLGMLGGITSQGGNPKDKKTLLVGAGGAGTAIAQALLEAGVSELAIHDADAARRDGLVNLLKQHYGSRVYAGSNNPAGFALVVNATPMGMRAEDPYPVDVEQLSADAFAACVITVPAVSPWVQAAREKGCRSSVGIDMYKAEQQLMVDFFLEKSSRTPITHQG
jgi:shikimate dehydrogenase